MEILGATRNQMAFLFSFILLGYMLSKLNLIPAMPLGLNTVVIPSAYGKDTKMAAGMALITHVLRWITIPIILCCIRQYKYRKRVRCNWTCNAP